MQYINKSFSLADTPSTTIDWQNKSDDERLNIIIENLSKNEIYKDFDTIRADKDGQVIIRIEKNIPAGMRGEMLLNLEEDLKKNIDMGITIWLEPVGDKSKLRNLRGINIKSD
tara:strand:+ start:200 stop:538 length:339 start_codon:yes stop_codon:yes gene_type:complete